MSEDKKATKDIKSDSNTDQKPSSKPSGGGKPQEQRQSPYDKKTYVTKG